METVSFATANRACPERVSYAYQMLLKGHGYQSAAMSAGLSAAKLRELCPPVPRKPVDPVAHIIEQTCRRYGVSRRVMMQGGAERESSYPRQEACARLWREYGMRHEDIGALFGRHHSTICTSIQRYDERKAWGEVIRRLAPPVHRNRPQSDRNIASCAGPGQQITGIFES